METLNYKVLEGTGYNGYILKLSLIHIFSLPTTAASLPMYSAKPGLLMLMALSGRKEGATVNLMVGSSLIFLCQYLSLIHI